MLKTSEMEDMVPSSSFPFFLVPKEPLPNHCHKGSVDNKRSETRLTTPVSPLVGVGVGGPEGPLPPPFTESMFDV